MKNLLKNFIIFFAVFLVLAGVFSLLGGGNLVGKPASTTDMDIGTMVQDINNGTVNSITVDGTKLTVTLADKSVKIVQKEQTESLSDLLKNYGVTPDKIEKIN